MFAVYRFGAEKLRTEAVNEVFGVICSFLGVIVWFVVWDWRLETSTNLGVHDLVSEMLIPRPPCSCAAHTYFLFSGRWSTPSAPQNQYQALYRSVCNWIITHT